MPEPDYAVAAAQALHKCATALTSQQEQLATHPPDFSADTLKALGTTPAELRASLAASLRTAQQMIAHSLDPDKNPYPTEATSQDIAGAGIQVSRHCNRDKLAGDYDVILARGEKGLGMFAMPPQKDPKQSR